uniref:Calponin-homology (CH) domain-containing protein n=1 Tax=Globodera pallida TaxID=36090 RepID=A0A183C715_GLOPA
MLFSGGGTKGTPPKEQRKERKPDRAEKYEIQEAVFVRWANSIIDDDVTVQELRDLTDVRFLSKFSTLILGVPVAIAGKSETDAIDAIFHAMLPDDPDDKLFQISVNELLSGQQKTLLGMCWRLIQIYWSKFAPSPSNERKLTEALKEWCLKTTSSSPDVLINDFTSSFRDGMAINILIKSFDESLIDLREISELRGEDRIENALSLARRHFRVPKLIQPKEFYSEHLDMKSVACYLMMLYLGMCEKTGTQQRDPTCAIRRRSTITAPPPAAVVYAPASADQQQQPHHSPTSSIARPSLVHQRSLSNQQVMPSVPIIVHPQQQQQDPSQFPTQTTPTPVLQPSSTLLSPPAVTQSFKAVAKMASLPVTTTTTAISPLAKQSHNQTQLFQHHVIQQMQQQHPQQFHVQVGPNDLQTVQHQPQQFAQVVMQREPTQIMQPLIWPQLPQHAQAVQPTGFNLQQQQPTIGHQTTVQPSADQPQSFEQQPLLIPPTRTDQAIPAAVQAPIPSSSHPQHSMPSYEASIVPPLPSLPSQHSTSGDAPIEGFRSRKSSSSSRSRSRKLRKPEEMIQEYGNCFQQVLNWLNEAEHDLDTMKKRAEMDEDITSLEIAKEKFREHELYMQSLTQSQESVGRVLHRGHQLSQRLEGEKAALIFSELEAVSGRWERIRELAMRRQTALQNHIDSIQRRHLKDILAWLDHAETTSKDQEIVADGVERCRTQRSDLIELKRRMKEKQQSIERLSTFVTVVDQITQQQPETVGAEGIVAKSEQTTTTTLQMETVVKQVIKRWEKLNEWVEQREKVLDEIEKLLEQYEQNSEELSRWLDNQLDELQNLQTSEDQLEGGEEVQERLDELSQLGKTLEAQQEALVRLSQVCTELAAKFEKGANAEASAKVRHRLDNVTHKWDQIVAGLEEHSEKLIRSGKVRLGGPEDEEAGNGATNGQKRLERLQTIISMDESAEQQQISPQMKRRKQLQQSMEQFLVEMPEEVLPTSGEELKFGIGETPSTSTKCLEGEEQANPDSTAAESLSPAASSYTLSPPQQTVTNFLKKVAVVDQKIGPLVEWAANAETTSSSTSKGNVRQMVLTCQKKLDDMRELEPEMTKLQILLEHIHNRANLNAKQLHVVNEMFDIFMSRWSKVVATISQLLSALSKPEPLVPKKMSMQNKDKEGRVAKMVEQLSQWLIASAKYVDDLPPQCPPGEKLKKIAQIARQLSEQQTQLSQVKRLARFTEEEKGEMEVMEREMVELLGRIDQARKEAERCERALKMPTTTVQMRRDDSSPELAKFQPLHGTSNISPPPLNEAESLRQKLLMEEAELANREEVEGREAEGNEWAQWLKKEESQLRLTEQCVPGDLNKLLEELEKCDKMIIELRKRLRDASTSESDPEMIGPFKQLLRTAETKRNHCMDNINKTQLAIHKAVKMEEVGDKFKRELDWLRRNSEETSPKYTEEKLRHLKEALNAQLGSKTEAVQLLDDLTQSVASAAGENAPVVKQMQLRMSKLDQQWLSISAEIEELLLCCAVERQKRADLWLTTKEEIVQELELAIRASFESATDAEELSEHLDNLERLLDRMNSLDEEAAEEAHLHFLQSFCTLPDKTRGDALANAVQERCAQLRNAVTRCEHFERKLCKMQGWCTLIHQILNQRFAPDTSALEVPHEYKDAQRTGSLFKQVDKEFVEFDALVNELEQYIGQSKFEFASTERLRLQLNHANEQIEQLRSKYGEFKQPITLYEKMERIQKQLEEANSSMKDLNEEIQVIKRWEKLNEWVEQREKVLDEIEKLLEQYEQNSEDLSRWLDNQLDELQNLQTSEDQLEGGEEVQERLDELSQLGKTLEAQQEALVRLSQVCTELAAKFEKGANAEASAKVRHRLDNVTHKWDQIVAGLEEHSEKLIRSGKVRLGGSEDEAAGNGQKRLERLQTIISMDESAEQQQISPQMKRRKQLQQSMEQFLVEAENCEFFVLHARQIAVQLQDLGSECAACEVARDTLIREGILEEEQALNISTRLGQLNAKCVEELEPKALRAVHRFERAAELLQKLEREKAVMDKLAKEAENRVGEGKNHPLTIKAMDELNRQVKAATDAAGKTKELEQLLKQLSIQLQKDIYESIAVTEQKCAQLKEQIDQWAQRTAEEGPAQIDEEKVLAEVAAMAQTLGESIGRVEAMLAEGQLDATFLEQQLNDIQPEKERFERKTLELLDNTEYRKRVAPALADLTFRWQRLSARSREAKKMRKETKKFREPEELEKETERASPSPGKAEEAIRGSNFGLKVQTMIEVFENAAQQLNFQKRPLSSLKEWEQRLSHSNQFVTTQKLRFDELIAEGKRLAESGPMELEVSAALAKLDKLIELVHQLDKQIESQEDRLFWTNKQLAKLDEQAELVRERMDTLERRTEQLDRTATDQTPIITIQYELMDTNGQLQLLQLSSDELRSNLPPSLCEEQIGSDVLEELNVQLKEIESRIQSALMFALHAQQHEQEVAEEAKSAKQRHESLAEAEEGEESDGIEEGTLLALDAYGTEDEEGKRSERMGGAAERKELLESSVSTRMPMPRRPSAQLQRLKETGIVGPGDEDELQPKLDEQVDLNQFYVNMDIMEEFMEQPELLPYEGFDEKADILNDFEMELERGQQLVMASQMTMEVGQAENIMERLNGLKAQLARRKVELEKRRETVQNLEELYTQCEGMLDELSQQCRAQQSPKRVKSPEGQQKKPPPRNESPDLDELEAMQTALENRVPPIAFRLQQIQNRLNAIAEYISTSARDRYQQRIQLFVDDFNEYAKLVKAKKRAMEERLADQTRISGQLEELEFWCDETEALVDYDEPIGALNMPKFEQHIEKVRERHESVDAKMNSFHNLDKLKDKFAALDSVEQQAKHEVRRSVAQLGKRISDLRMKLKERLDSLQEDKLSAEELWREFAAMEKWVDEAQRQLQAVEDAKIYKPSLANIERLASQISENRLLLQSINSRLNDENRIQNRSEPVNGKEGTVEGENVERVGRLISSFETVTSAIDRLLELRVLTSEDSSATEEEIEQLYEQMDSTRQKLAKYQKKSPKMGVGDGAEHVPMIEYGTLSTEGEEEGDEVEEEQRQNGAGIAHSTRPPRRKMSLGEQTRLDTVTRLRSWLQEVERDVSATVDLSDQHLIRQTLGKMQNCVDEIQIHHLEIVRVLEGAKDRLIIERAQLCTTEMERILGTCKRRKAELQHILEQCRIWEQLRSSIELWLTDANDRLSVGLRIAELSDSDLIEQLELCDQLVDELNNWKSKLQELNRVSNQLLDTHRRDNGHNLSHQSSKLNTQWTKFNDQLRIRRAVLEATKRSRHDFQTALGHFQQWLNKMNMELRKLDKETDNSQKLKDTVRRREWLAQEKEARVEIDAHREIMESVRRMGRKLMEEQQRELSSSAGDDSPALGACRDPPALGACRAGEQLKWRVDTVDGEWQALLELSRIVRERLESAQEECERLTQSLADFLSWTDQQLKTIAESKPIGNDLEAVQRQNEIVRTIERTIEARERQVDETIKLAHTFLMQHDLRPALHVPSLLDDDASDLFTPKNEVEREERRIGMQILADSGRLQTQWPLLKEQLGNWSENVTSALREMQELDRAMAEALLSIGAVEEGLNALKPVEQLRLEELKAARAECNEFRRRVHEAGTSVDDVNDWASNLQAVSIQLSERLDSQVQAVNARYERLKRDIGCRGAALERAFSDFGPSSEHFLVDLVEPPWQRAISTVNRLPYYIDHSSEQTQWDHPSMVDILEQLCSFNQVKFSAYRTAMKLRALQKRLCLDLIDLADLNVQYEKQLCNYTDEQRIQVEDVIQCLLPLFEKAQQERPALLSNVSLAVDLTLNLLLNIYDPCRDGKMRVLSFKVALVVLCHANLESKYTYLFHLISGPNGVDHKRLAILFYDLIHIPKFLGEAAAFGGSNIEPSVRSCFERVKFPPTINVEQFLEWLRKEPQSLVWLPVMHRLASSEFAKHQAKCNACKMFPVVGLRYRCLRCFNFDICQNCFFSQRTAKSHKLSHPMQEYCTPTSAGDDMRDFTVIIKNKVRQGKSRIGYLPVEQINEGPPLECNDQTPQNADTEAMHQRMQLIASRLDKRQIEAAEAFPSAIMPSEEQINGHLEKDNTPANEMAADVQNAQFPLKKWQKQSQKALGFMQECQRSNILVPHEAKSPNQLISQVDQASKEELGQLLQKLQYENIELKRAIDERRVALKAAGMPFPSGTKSTPNLCHQRTPMPGQLPNGTEMLGSAHPTAGMNGGGPRARTALSMPRSPPPPQNLTSAFPLQQQTVLPPPIQRHHFGGLADNPIPAASLHRQHSLAGGTSSTAFVASGSFSAVEGMSPAGQWQEMAVLAEAQHLRQHQKRLEERGMVLEDQNRQLQMQLERLQRLMEKTQPEQLHPGFISSTEAEDTDMEMLALAMPMRDIKAIGMSSGQLGTEIRRNRMDRLRETVDELNRAMENFVVFTQNCVQKEQQQQQDTDDSGTADNHQQTGEETAHDSHLASFPNI